MRPKRSRLSRVLEGAAVGGIVGVAGTLFVLGWIALSAAPFVVAGLVLYWLGAF